MIGLSGLTLTESCYAALACKAGVATLLTLTLCNGISAKACTRAVYLGTDDVVITGRSMDWAEDVYSNAWVFPRGMARDGATGATSIKWTSKYGSLVVSGYDAGTADGMNEQGLVANVLYLAESDYGAPQAGKPTISIMAWGSMLSTTTVPSPRRWTLCERSRSC